MKKEVMVLFVAVFFVILMASITIAENESNEASVVVNIKDNISNLSNMTFGKCVVEAAIIRQKCFEEQKNLAKECVKTAKQGKNKEEARKCLVSYKENKKNCMASFQEAKKNCIQTYKPRFWERIRYRFK